MDMKELQRGLVESSLNLGMLHSGIIIVGQKIGGGLVRCMQVEVKVHKPEDGEGVPEKPSVSVLLHPYVIPPYLIEEDASTVTVDVRDSSVVGEYRTPSPGIRAAYLNRVFGEVSPEKQKEEVQ